MNAKTNQNWINNTNTLEELNIGVPLYLVGIKHDERERKHGEIGRNK